MKLLYKFRYLSSDDRQLFCAAFLLLGLVRFMLFLLPFKTWRKLIKNISPRILKQQKAAQISVGQIAWAIDLSSRYMPGGAKCLARALTAQVLMSWHGYSSELRIGVAKGKEGQFEAHAWVEHQGQVTIGHLRDLSRYTLLSSLQGSK